MKKFFTYLFAVALTMAGAWAAYQYMFGKFGPHDDEGYLMMSLWNYLRGMPLYDQTYTQYGPFYFAAQKTVHSLLGLPVTHDAARIVALLYWIASSMLVGGIILARTRSILFGGASFVATLLALRVLAHEPGHPNEVVAFLLVVAFILSLFVSNGRFQTPALLALGAIGAALSLTKINVGVFYCLALANIFLAFCQRGRMRDAAFLTSAAASLILPEFLMRPHLQSWALGFSLVVSISILIVFLLFSRLEISGRFRWRDLGMLVLGFGFTALVVVGKTRVEGTSVHGLVDGILLHPLRHPGVFFIPFRTGAIHVLFSLFWLFVFLALWRWRDRPIVNTLVSVGKVAGAAAAILLIAIPGSVRLHFIAPLVWMILWPSSGARWQLSDLFPRYFACQVALLDMLQAYPVNGSQSSVAGAMSLPWAFYCVFDGLTELRSKQFQTAPGWMQVPFLWSPAVWATAVLLILLPASFPVLWGGGMRRGEGIALGTAALQLPGSDRVYLDPILVVKYRWLALNIREHCDTLFEMPGMGSLNFWSGVAPPNGFLLTAWMNGFEPEWQEEIVRIMRSRPRPCIVYSPHWVRLWMPDGPEPLATSAIAAYVANESAPVSRAGEFQIRLPLNRVSEWHEDILVRDEKDLRGTVVGVPDRLLDGTEEHTIRFWVRRSGDGLRMETESGRPQDLPGLSIGDAVVVKDSTSQHILSRALPPEVNVWHQIVLSTGNRHHAIFVDGSLLGTLPQGNRGEGDPKPYLLHGVGRVRDFITVRRAWSSKDVASDFQRLRDGRGVRDAR